MQNEGRFPSDLVYFPVDFCKNEKMCHTLNYLQIFLMIISLSGLSAMLEVEIKWSSQYFV